MRLFTLLLWYTIGAVINLALYEKGASYNWHYHLGAIVGLIGAAISG